MSFYNLNLGPFFNELSVRDYVHSFAADEDSTGGVEVHFSYAIFIQ